MFGAGSRDPDDVHLLKGVIADELRGHLAGQDHDRDGIHIGGGNAGYRVGGTRPGGHQTDPHLARGPGIAVRRVDGPLFMPDQDVPDIRFDQVIVDIGDRRRRGSRRWYRPPLPATR